jgi:hypothetical protein
VNDFNSRWVNETLQKGDNIIFDWNPQMEPIDIRPPKFEWLPIGLYNGVDIPDTQIGGFYSGFNDSTDLIIEEDYIVWVKVPNPEYDCEVIIE